MNFTNHKPTNLLVQTFCVSSIKINQKATGNTVRVAIEHSNNQGFVCLHQTKKIQQFHLNYYKKNTPPSIHPSTSPPIHPSVCPSNLAAVGRRRGTPWPDRRSVADQKTLHLFYWAVVRTVLANKRSNDDTFDSKYQKVNYGLIASIKARQ